MNDDDEAMLWDRAELIARCSWWSGWCTDNDVTLPELTQLGYFLLGVKHQMALDRPEGEAP